MKRKVSGGGAAEAHSHLVSFKPFARRARVAPDTTLLDAARQAGVRLQSLCGGTTTCSLCVVELDPSLRMPAPAEERALLDGVGAAPGARLACRVRVDRDLDVTVPAQSLATSQRLHLEAFETTPDICPAVAGSPLLGLAIDIGTTKIAAYLVDLETGQTIAADGLMNPQITYGEDVMARIAYAGRSPEAARTLQRELIEKVNRLIARLSRRAKIRATDIADVVAVGNTAMHHLFLGLPVERLGRAPYLAARTDAMDTAAANLGLDVGGDARVHTLPNVAGFVGADHVAMLLATLSLYPTGVVLALDVGTNTEITLRTPGEMVSCSCASGPVFEGAHISSGMRASRGAIERLRVEESGSVQYQTVGGRPPVGLCGSGVLDAVAQLWRRGFLAPSGALRDGPGVIAGPRGKAFVVAPAAGRRADVLLTAEDVGQVQLAKAAIRAGAEILMSEAGVKASDLEAVVLAGTFGTYLDPASAIAIGMFPPVPPDRFRQVGNAAGAGARAALLSVRARKRAVELAGEIKYVELMTHPRFTDTFTDSLILDGIHPSEEGEAPYALTSA